MYRIGADANPHWGTRCRGNRSPSEPDQLAPDADKVKVHFNGLWGMHAESSVPLQGRHIPGAL